MDFTVYTSRFLTSTTMKLVTQAFYIVAKMFVKRGSR